MGGDEEEVEVGGHRVRLSNTGKVLFPADGVTKGDLVGYYREVAPAMVPYLRDRPLAVARHPDGIDGERIFQKNVPEYVPGWVRRVRVPKQDGEVLQAVCDDAATLVYLANQACVEFHVFLSRVDRLDDPDQLVFDLDPPDASRFADARRTALRLRRLLEEDLELTTFVKTTGGKGLHVHVPLDRDAGFDDVRDVAREIAEILARAYPDEMTTEQRKDRRGDRLFLDVMRNAYAQTVVAPFSVRARPGAHVATPLHWDEVEDPTLTPGRFTVSSIAERLNAADDPWSGLGRHHHGLAPLRERLQRITRDGER